MESSPPPCDLELRGSLSPPPSSGGGLTTSCVDAALPISALTYWIQSGGHRRHPIDAYYKERAIRLIVYCGLGGGGERNGNH